MHRMFIDSLPVFKNMGGNDGPRCIARFGGKNAEIVFLYLALVGTTCVLNDDREAKSFVDKCLVTP